MAIDLAPRPARENFIVIVADDADQFQREINLALANGFQLYGEYHYCTWLDDAAGRVEQWSIAMTKERPLQ